MINITRRQVEQILQANIDRQSPGVKAALAALSDGKKDVSFIVTP